MQENSAVVLNDPSAMVGLDFDVIANHYGKIIRSLRTPAILIVHSIDGFIVQMLLARGVGAAGLSNRVTNSPQSNEKGHWESVHVCPKCGHLLNLAEIDLRAITTGIVSCPNCNWSGPIDIQIVDGKALPE